MKVVLQEGQKDCGICCLLSIIRYYGGDVSKEYLRVLTNTTKDGVSAYNLIQAAKKLGIEAYGVRGDYKEIKINNLPCIAHVNINSNYQHFVVIYKIEDKKITIMDPSVGKRILSVAEFKLMSTNNYILFEVKKKLPLFNNKRISKNFIHKFIKEYKLYFLLLSFLTFNILIIDIILAFNFKYIINYSINYFYVKNIIYISGSIILFIIIYTFLSIVQKKILYKIIINFDEKITFTTFKQLLLLPYLYYKNRTVGEVLTRFNDLNIIKNYIVQFISYFLSDFISLIIFFIFLFSINKLISCFILTYFILNAFFIFIRNNKKKVIFKKVKAKEDLIQSFIVESLSNVDTTKGCHLEKRFTDKFLINYKKFLNDNYHYINNVEFNILIFNFFEKFLLVLIYSVVAYLIIVKKFRIENMFIYISFYQYLLNIYNRLINLLENKINYNISINRVEELFTILHEDFTKSYYYLNYTLNGVIKYYNLYYKVNNKVIFNKINFTINVGDKVLLFGDSGSGKSTLVKMLLRYIEVPYKMISIDGIDINHYHLENIRRYICYVSSDELLFNDTIYNNICLYKDISEEEFLNIINICRVDKIFGREVNNYRKMIEENGIRLSSGERARIILARSLVKKSSIYIFDEAFGQIDIELTNKILKDMFSILKDKIVIVISHRKNNKKYFNRIVKLVDGKLNEI